MSYRVLIPTTMVALLQRRTSMSQKTPHLKTPQAMRRQVMTSVELILSQRAQEEADLMEKLSETLTLPVLDDGAVRTRLVKQPARITLRGS
jgi:hypothetical protein